MINALTAGYILTGLERIAALKPLMLLSVAGLLCGAALCPGSSPAQDADDLSEAQATLTGKVARQWVLNAISSVLGPGDRCSGGEAARFKATKMVQLRSCKDGKLVTRDVPWTMKANGGLDPILTFDGVSYELYFKKIGPVQTMRLRIPGRTKINPARDHTYRLSQ